MKIEPDKKLVKYSIYITLTVVAIYISIFVLNHAGHIISTIIDSFVILLGIIKPLLIGFVIAYLLFPVTVFIEKVLEKNKICKIKNPSTRRIWGVLVSFLLIFAIITSLIWGIYFMIGGQLQGNMSYSKVVEDITNYLNNSEFNVDVIQEKIDEMGIPFLQNLDKQIINLVISIQKYVISNIGNMTASLMAFGSNILSFFLALVVSFYLMKDCEYFIRIWRKLFNLIFKNGIIGRRIAYIGSTFHGVFSRYIRGQLIEAFLIGVLSAIVLTIIGIDYAVMIGAITGVCNLIPYVGPVVGTILACIMGLLSGNFITIIYVIIAMLLVQQADNNFLAPKIVGESVGLHPVFTMAAIIVGSQVGGLFGMLLAVPIAASLKMLFKNWYKKIGDCP